MSKLYFTVGIPGSGKSHWSEDNKERLNAVVHSSDEIRAELGDVTDQSQNELVFNTLHKRVKEDLLNGKNVIYDSTGLKRKNRLHLINNILKDVPCEKICVLFATPIECCKKNNNTRDRKIPEEVIERMIRSFEIPCKQEGWNDIQIVYWDYKKDGLKFNINHDLFEFQKIPHDNPHHHLSIGDHMLDAYKYYVKDVGCFKVNKLIATAILLHDCGKPYVKSFIDKNGNLSDTAKYYNHQYVSAYNSLFYLNDFKDSNWNDGDTLYTSLLVELHMRPFLAYDNSEKSENKDRIFFGNTIIDQVLEIHKYDLLAH